MIRARHIPYMLLSTVLMLAGCDDFLDASPDNRVELNTLDRAAQLLTNGYSSGHPGFVHWMSDDVRFTVGTTIRPFMEEIYQWEEVTTGSPDEQDSPDYFWYETYRAIAHANEVLEVLDDLPVVSEEDEQRRDALEGEAKLIRAWGHFMLANVFCEDYTGESASSDLGIPYLKSPETSFLATYSRPSLRQVYNEIEDDLRDGLELVNDNFYLNSGKYHFNQNAALAFASRFYLYKLDLEKCLEYSNQLLGASPESFIRDFTSDRFQSARSSINDYPQVYTSPDLAANLLLIRKVTWLAFPSFGYSPPSDLYSSVFSTNPFRDATDARENPALQAGRDRNGETGSFPLRYPILFQRTSLNSNVGTGYTVFPALTGEEVLFNRMECYLYQGRYDEFMEDLNVLYARRYTDGENVATIENLRELLGVQDNPDFSDGLVLFNVLIFEKRKEFFAHGMRWFDGKRWGLTFEHDLENGSIDQLEPDDPRWLLQIPPSAVEVAGLEKNDR